MSFSRHSSSVSGTRTASMRHVSARLALELRVISHRACAAGPPACPVFNAGLACQSAFRVVTTSWLSSQFRECSALQIQQVPLAGLSPTEPREGAVRANDSMTRYEYADWILPV